MIIAIDGPAAAGKGTLARRLAREFDLAYLDTGSLYRAAAVRLVKAGLDAGNEKDAAAAAKSVKAGDINLKELRGEQIGKLASTIAQFEEVRAVLVDLQRKFGNSPPDGKKGAVLDGRDIGTVVFPDADIKIFVTADPESRAKRRYLELSERGLDADEAKIRSELRDRDSRDTGRKASPLKPAEDAHLLDTTNLDIDAAFEAARSIVLKALSQKQK